MERWPSGTPPRMYTRACRDVVAETNREDVTVMFFKKKKENTTRRKVGVLKSVD